eukprot:COSAG02_NODE_7867_length_2811_cov_6.892440_2_plen_67_part_00
MAAHECIAVATLNSASATVVVAHREAIHRKGGEVGAAQAIFPIVPAHVNARKTCLRAGFLNRCWGR